MYDWELTAEIDRSKYDYAGGLPSEKANNLGVSYASVSQYYAADRAQSYAYRNAVGKYLIDQNITVKSNAGMDVSAIELVRDSAIDLVDNWGSRSIWKNLKAIGNLISTFVSNIGRLIKDFFANLEEKVFSNLMVPAYLGYNVPSRTTYSGSALTGSGYKLPKKGDALQGYAFYGAELEYIIAGENSERLNQAAVFGLVYVMRFFFDLAFVCTNREVRTIAKAAASGTFGLGGLLVFMLYALGEPLVDALILSNGGNVPIIKNVLYLTPSGITDLIGAFYHLTLSDEQKNDAYKDIVKVMSAGEASDEFAETFTDAERKHGKTVLKTMTVDYTKTLILSMALFKSEDDLLKRFADVIQMEAAYQNAAGIINAFNFNLDKSYTCVRASGSFSANEFIKVSEFAGLDSSKRVVYRGY